MKKKNAAAVELGKRGGKKRSKTLTPEQRSEIARKAGHLPFGTFDCDLAKADGAKRL